MIRELTLHSDKAVVKKVAASILAVTLLLGVVGFEALRVTRVQEINLSLVTHTYALRDAINEIVENIRTAGTSHRAYVLRGSAEDLKSFETAVLDYYTNITKLSSLVADNPHQSHQTEILSSHSDKRIADLIGIVNKRRLQEIPAEEQQALSLRGVAQTGAIILAAEELKNEENRMLEIRLKNAAESRQQTQTMMLSSLSLSILVVVLSGLAILRDVRDRLTVERRLRDNAALLEKTLNLQRTIVDSAGYAIIASNTQGLIKRFNPAAEKLLGFRAHEVIDKINIAQFHDREEIAARDNLLSRDQRTLEPTAFNVVTSKARLGQIDESEWIYIRKNGVKIPVQMSVAAIHASDGLITGFLTIAGDISERKKIERLKNEFISTVSHELRTPLTSIRGSLGLILGGVIGELPAQAKGLMVIANKNAERLSRLINDILDSEKIASGKMDFRIKQQRLSPLLQQALEGIIDYGRQFNVTFELQNLAPDCEANVDSDRFLQVMANLMSNAAKFSPNGGTVIVAINRSGNTVRISVSDRGKGIPSEFQAQVFEKFAQADGSDSKLIGGTGLGLSITKSIVEKMHGKISFESVEGLGTTFHVDFPEHTATAAHDGLAVQQPLAMNGRSTILLCENEPKIAEMMKINLDQGGYDSDIVTTLAEAKNRLREKTYEALSLNIATHRQTGQDMFENLRADPMTRDVPIVVTSTQAGDGTLIHNRSAITVVDWLTMPIDHNRLMNAVQQAIQGHGQARILHIEDDLYIAHFVAGMIGSMAKIDNALNLSEARVKLQNATYDLILLDLVLPDGEGVEILSLLDSRTPIVIFSNHNQPEIQTQQVSSALTMSLSSNVQLRQRIN